VSALLAGLGVEAGLAEMRAGLDRLAASVSDACPVAHVEDVDLPLPHRTIRLRTYADRPGPLPDLVWFHGGGFISGTLDAIDPVCRELAVRAPVRVVSVDYRLAPEHPYPAAVEDALAVVLRLQPAAVGGDSAGGNLAAVVAQRHRELRGQLLLCPLLDCTLTSPSVHDKADGYGLTAQALRVFVQLYAGTADLRDPGLSPLLSEDLAGLPPAVIVTAEHDPLHDDGSAYAARLQAAGTPAQVRCWPEQLHGFPGLTAETPAAGEALQWAADALTRLLA
jgi:acetyl esterase